MVLFLKMTCCHEIQDVGEIPPPSIGIRGQLPAPSDRFLDRFPAEADLFRPETLADGFCTGASGLGADFDALGSAVILMIVVDAIGYITFHTRNGAVVFSVFRHENASFGVCHYLDLENESELDALGNGKQFFPNGFAPVFSVPGKPSIIPRLEKGF